MKNIISYINEELLKIKQNSSKYTVAFYRKSNTLEPWDFAIPLMEFLQEKMFHAIILIGYDNHNICSDKINIYHINPEDLISIENLDALIVIDDDRTAYPATTRVLAIAHGFNAGMRDNFSWCIYHQCYYDGYLTSIPLQSSAQSVSQLWTGFYNKDHLHNSSDFHIISCGYLRAAVLHAKINAQSGIQPDAICYAPVGRTYKPDIGGDRILKYGEKILHILLTEFPERKIIFRPPFLYTAPDPEILAIAEKFSSNKNFSLDLNSDRFFCFANSAILLTDFSHIANSFSFTTYRPSIFFQPWISKKTPMVSEIGCYTYSFSQLIKIVKILTYRKNYFKQIIHSASKKLTMPIDNSFEQFYSLLISFITNDFSKASKNSYISISRNIDNFDQINSLYNYIVKTDNFPSPYAAYNFTDIFPLCVSSLANAKLNPNESIPPQIIDKLSTIDICAHEFKTYSDVKQLCILFVKKNLLNFIKNNNAEGVFVCQKVLEYIER